jgi:hypothetical protein
MAALANVSATTNITNPAMNDALYSGVNSVSATPPIKYGTATCQFFSFTLSACHAVSIIAIEAQSAGIPDSRIARVDCALMCFPAAAAAALDAAGAAPLLVLLARAVPDSMLLMMTVSHWLVPMADTTTHSKQ